VTMTADVVIIGGGVVGCATAYELARLGVKQVVLVEREYLASGATGRCGAGVRQQWGTRINCLLTKASIALFETMNEDLGYSGDIEFKQGGYLILAYTSQGWAQFARNVALQTSLGIPARLCAPDEAVRIVPHLNTEGLFGATFCPKDGHINPFKVTQAYAEAAARLGVEIRKFTEVTGVKVVDGRVAGVSTTAGDIATPLVLNATGPHAPVIGRMVGVEIPIINERHQILVTEPVAPMQGPMVISFHHGLYCQQTPHGSFIMGVGDPHEPKDFDIGHSWSFLRDVASKVTRVLPPLKDLRIVRQWSGLYDLTVDRQPVLDEAPQARGFHIAAGFSGHGFMIAPMIAKIMAARMTGATPPIDVSALDLGRFSRGELVTEPSVV
jgi:sarcosine oxidase subunit beta